MAKDPLYCHLIDVNWWSDNSLILARTSGSVTVSSADTLKNQLGESCEWFEPLPKVSQAFNKGFLTLECDCQIITRKRSVLEKNDSIQSNDSMMDDSSDDEDVSLVSKSSRFIKTALFYMTDSERFQPPIRRPKSLVKTYKLLSLRSTTPEELFTRKMDLEEYGEALSLAKAYGLDADLVYQRQWRKAAVTVASIQDYLSKIKKRSWVLHECLERVPEDIDAAQELLLYGLCGSSFKTFIDIGKGKDDGKFKMLNDEQEYGKSYNLKKMEDKLLQSIDCSNLTIEQKQLCQIRFKLLIYLDRLKTYEVMLGGYQVAADNFDPKFYQKFRNQSAVEASVEFARNSNWQFVEIMFARHREEIKPYMLAILSNFPETAPCYEYRHLLPGNDEEITDDEFLLWEGEQKRCPDWCERSLPKELVAPVFHHSVVLYDECPELAKYHGKQINGKLLTEWYLQRAIEIEQRSCLVDNALELIKLGRAKNLKGLEDLHDDLVTLETLVYDCQIDFSLEHYRALSDIQRVNLLMSTVTDDVYIKYLRRWLLPFLENCDKRKPGSKINLLRQYMVDMAKDDLSRCVQICDHSRIDSVNPIIPFLNELMDIAIQCVYSSLRNDQIGLMKTLLECLPTRGFGPTTPEAIKLHDWVDEFEKHLQAAMTLNRNHIPQTLKYIRDCQDDAEEVKSLLTKLLRTAARKHPPLSEDQWKVLLCDLLSLQETFQCVSPNLCHEIYAESLLCSNNTENIQRAGRLMECTRNEPRAYEKKVSYDRAVEIVLSAAREYFNSSSSLIDPNMDLARACLQLITDLPLNVEAELDLISALGLLNEYDISILPLQVRLCDDRLRLIEMVLNSNSQSYRNSQRLLRLGHLLRVADDDRFEREGRVLTLTASKALECEDYLTCYNICEQIMVARHNSGWDICHQLGQCNQFDDLKARCQLLSFAVTHCSSDQIESIIKSRCLIELQLLNEKLHSKMDSSLDEEHFVDAVSDVGNCGQMSPMSPKPFTKQMFQSTSKVTKEILSSVTSQSFWNHTFGWLKPFRQSQIEKSIDVKNNEDFQLQGIDAFYKDLVTPCHISQFGADYKHYSPPLLSDPSLEFSQILLRSALLAETLTEGENLSLNSIVLLNLAEDTIHEDCAFGLAYLMALNDPSKAEECLKSLPNSSISLHVRCYYFALQILVTLNKDMEGFPSPLYLQVPDTVVQTAMHVIQMEDYDGLKDENVSSWVKYLRHYYDILSDLIQGQILHRLSRGVDVVRFSYDGQYKRETILGLAMTLDDKVFNIAKSLADKHVIPLSELYLVHLEYLFSESDLSTQDIEKRMEKLNLIEELSENCESFAKCLVSSVYPTIAGTDHSRLLLYYQLLEKCSLPTSSNFLPSVNVKLLKKIKTAAPGLDYKHLMDGKTDPLQTISEVLTNANVHVFANMSVHIPYLEGTLDSSNIYCTWAQKMFLQNAWQSEAPGVTTSEWIHRYEACGQFLHKLQPKYLTQFVDRTLFSTEGCTMMTKDSRKEILRRILKYARQQLGRCQDEMEKGEWEKCIEGLSKAIAHLEWMQNDLIIELLQSDDEVLHQFLLELDVSQSSPTQVQLLLEKSILEGHPFVILQQLISICPPGVSLTPGEVVNNALHHIVDVLSGSTVEPRFTGDAIDTLKQIVNQTHKYAEESDDVIIVEDMLNILRPFCADNSIPIQIRLKVLEILEEAFTLDNDDSGLILLYRTQVFVAAAWPNFEINSEDVATDSSRRQLFTKLVADCSNVRKVLVLSKLLSSWPTLSSAQAKNPEENPWYMLLMVLLQCPEPQYLDLLVSILREHLTNESFLSAQMYKKLVDNVQSKGSTIHTVKVALLSNHEDIHEIAIEELLKAKEIRMTDIDEQILNLILQRHLVPRLVRSPIYGCIVDHVIDSQREDVPEHLWAETVARDLKDAGYNAEAGTLLLQSRSVPTMLQNFQAATIAVQRWIK